MFRTLSGQQPVSPAAPTPTSPPQPDAPHFVRDYQAYVAGLLSRHTEAEAMAFAVGGGDFDANGRAIVDVLKRAGLRSSDAVLDLGCGSGRVAKQLGAQFPNMTYTGLDIVPELLDYARTQAPAHFRFILNHELALPVADDSVDFFFAFSVFTHLLHQESYLYLRDARRAVKPGGRIVFSFLESENSWPVFEGMVERAGMGVRDDQLNMFMERPQIERWARELDLKILGWDFGTPHDGRGQTVVAMEV